MNKGLLLVPVAILFFFAFGTSATAQIRIVDTKSFQKFCIPLFEPTVGTNPGLTKAMPLLEDGWTAELQCVLNDPVDPSDDDLEPETYLFAGAGGVEIVFIDKIKLANRKTQTPYVVAEDIFILPCRPRCAENPCGEDFRPNMPPPMMILDDVTFPLLKVQQPFAQEYLCGVSVPIEVITEFFGPILGFPMCLDWFACADLDTLGAFYGQPPTPDLDLDGCPDVCIELGQPGNLVPHKGLDEKGAELLDFLLNARDHLLTKVDVHEPQTLSFFPPISPNHPFFPGGCPEVLPGMKFGESKNTRPWCFTIVAVRSETSEGDLDPDPKETLSGRGAPTPRSAPPIPPKK